MKDILGAISADVVDSTSLAIEDMIGLRDEIYNCFSDIKSCFPNSGFWGRLVKGDSIECCLDAPILSLRLVLLLKCRIKAWAADKSCSNALKELGIRYSIGIGKMRIVDPVADIMDGDAIYIAGRNLNRMAETHMTSFFGMQSANMEIQTLICTTVVLLDNVMNSLSAKQCIVIYHKLLGLTEQQISKLLLISQSSVNTRAKNGGWNLIKDTLNIFEKIDFSTYVE